VEEEEAYVLPLLNLHPDKRSTIIINRLITSNRMQQHSIEPTLLQVETHLLD
jgi:hypothetical protein